MMSIQHDGNGSPYLEWAQSSGEIKRAWVTTLAPDHAKNWAGTGRYLNVSRCNRGGHVGGTPVDFPIFNDLPDEQILWAFLYSVTAITSCPLR